MFQRFPKMARLSRECVVTEKIDGTNSQIYLIHKDEFYTADVYSAAPCPIYIGDDLVMFVGSRNRLITPGDDNYGFARWAVDNAAELIKLGPGRHFGEWWGAGIQRRYGLSEKRFSLFNTTRWCAWDAVPKDYPTTDPRIVKTQEAAPKCCHIVPEIYRGVFDTRSVGILLDKLATEGSVAAPGFAKPEGIVVFHTASGTCFKKTVENDGEPKGKTNV